MDKLLSIISLCRRAQKLATGAFACETALRGEAHLIVIAADASENTRRKFVNKAFFYKIPVYICGTIADLSKASGTANRAVFVVTEKGLAANIINIFRDNNLEATECQK
ncbi:MAG: 50S ribosomal protein L7ae [Clostridiales bacterium]|jgi:ribosomal protein L7Ae-like RNA K-turn-binding protein|nr:50S ribosomal protein L7ae [Clostridiales bacterium]